MNTKCRDLTRGIIARTGRAKSFRARPPITPISRLGSPNRGCLCKDLQF